LPRQLAALNERSLTDLVVLVIYIDGIIVDGHHIIAAVGVDEAGDKTASSSLRP
jgi:putative transposase